jgi:hypothetical protein
MKQNTRISALLLIIVMTFVGISWSFLILKEFRKDLWDVEISHLINNYEIDHPYCIEEIKLSDFSSHVDGMKGALRNSFFSLIAISKTNADLIEDIRKSYSKVDVLIGWTMHLFGSNSTFYDDAKVLEKINSTGELEPNLTHLPGRHSAVVYLNHQLDDFKMLNRMINLNMVPEGINPVDYITESVILISNLVHDAITIEKNKELEKLRQHVFIATVIFLLISLYLAYRVYYKNLNVRILLLLLVFLSVLSYL